MSEFKSEPQRHGELPHVVIVGGGFGGLSAVRALRRDRVRITLIDQQNYHLFQPLLYQVATTGLAANDIAHPIRSIVRRQKNVTVMMAEVLSVDTQARRVVLRDRELDYDYLVLATGAGHSYFGHPEWAALAPGLKDLDDAYRIRHRLLHAFEMAEIETNSAKRRALLTFVVVGGGPTGVELAGALGELACNVLAKDFRNVDPRTSRIILAESGSGILPMFPEKLAAKAEASLRKLCVDVRIDSPVTAISPGTVCIGEEVVNAETIIWAAGVEASPLGRTIGVPTDRSGRVFVEPNLSIPGHPEVFVIGDLAALHDKTGIPLPGLAPVAIQQGRHAARSVRQRCNNSQPDPFKYSDRGMLATIGRGAAVAAFSRFRLFGFPAWIAWALVHILQLIGFRNRFVVLFEWAWAFVTQQRSARLIAGEETEATRLPSSSDSEKSNTQE